MNDADEGGGCMTRRRALLLGALALSGLVLQGHAPYGQWSVYRKKHLLILTTKVDPQSFDLGKKLAAYLSKILPESRAQVSRAPHKTRIASLISSKQMELALMRPDDAAALRAGTAPYEDYGPVPLNVLMAMDDFLLVCREDFAPLHAWLIAEALSRKDSGIAARPAQSAKPESPDPHLPLHQGTVMFLSGAAMPPAPEPVPDGHTHD
jgi:hypothetical protein